MLGNIREGEYIMSLRADRKLLESYGYIIGVRDCRINTGYPGKFMVVEAHEQSELPTKDGRNGPWCIVGDNQRALISEAASVLRSML